MERKLRTGLPLQSEYTSARAYPAVPCMWNGGCNLLSIKVSFLFTLIAGGTSTRVPSLSSSAHVLELPVSFDLQMSGAGVWKSVLKGDWNVG